MYSTTVQLLISLICWNFVLVVFSLPASSPQRLVSQSIANEYVSIVAFSIHSAGAQTRTHILICSSSMHLNCGRHPLTSAVIYDTRIERGRDCVHSLHCNNSTHCWIVNRVSPFFVPSLVIAISREKVLCAWSKCGSCSAFFESSSSSEDTEEEDIFRAVGKISPSFHKETSITHIFTPIDCHRTLANCSTTSLRCKREHMWTEWRRCRPKTMPSDVPLSLCWLGN